MPYKHLSIEEREAIQLKLWEGRSIRGIARDLNRSPASVFREIKRNTNPTRRRYTPRSSHERALKKRSSRGRAERLKNDAIRHYVTSHLKQGWSPEQIAGRIRTALPGETISHEAIYQYVYAQVYRHGHGYLKPGREDLRPYLKRRHSRRISKGARKHRKCKKSQGPSIETRPVVVERRSRIGDWESDSIASRWNAPGLNSIVERKSGYVLLSKLDEKTADATAAAIIARLAPLPQKLRQTITFDNGSENERWRMLEEVLGVECFFAHPYASYERGTNENTNGLVRWYFPKRTDFATVSEEAIRAVEEALNSRPRKRLGWKTPREVLTESVALQG